MTANDFLDVNSAAERLLEFPYHWESTAEPFEWKFTRKDLSALLAKNGLLVDLKYVSELLK